MRYIANKYSLESWYPTDPKQRAVCELALDFHSNNFGPIVGPKIVYEVMKWATPTTAEKEEAQKKWNDEVMPTMTHILKLSGGPLIGGAKPCIADLAFLGSLVMLTNKCPNSYAATNDTVKKYFADLKAALPKYDKYMKEVEDFWKKS